jgi:hypothetical protein
MSSSTSSSRHRRFLGWVALALVAAYPAVQLIPWGGVAASGRAHGRAAKELAGAADFLIVGDSKAGPFSIGCLIPWLDGYRGLVFSADSVTPIFHLHNLIHIRQVVPEFRPKVVFIFLGANNFNTNGLHVEREYTFFNELPLDQTWDLSGRQGEYLFFAEALLSRAFPLYGKRVAITHLQFGEPPNSRCTSTSPENYEQASYVALEPANRNAVLDRNYYDIYRRSVYSSYESSPLVARATERLIDLVEAYGGFPVLVLPPVTPEIRGLEAQLIGDRFDETLRRIAAAKGTQVLDDLRDQNGYDFADVNHLSKRGARDLAFDHFLPILARHVAPVDVEVSRRALVR